MAKMKELDALLTELSEHSAGIAEAVRDIRALLSFNEAKEAAGQAPEKKPCTGVTTWPMTFSGAPRIGAVGMMR